MSIFSLLSDPVGSVYRVIESAVRTESKSG